MNGAAAAWADRRRSRGGVWKMGGRRSDFRVILPSVGSITWSQDVAEVYDATSSAMFEPSVLDPTFDRLAEVAQGGPVLELAVGPGRVALPLSGRDVSVHGIELSPHMVEQLRAKPGAD